MKVFVLQPALPHYRLDFFRRVYSALGDTFAVYYSPTILAGITTAADSEPWARRIGALKPIAPGLEWQEGALSLQFERGDVVVVCGAPRTLSTLAVIAKAKLNGAKVIWWGHFWTSTSKEWRFRFRMQMLRVCDGVLFYNDNEVEEYLALRKGRTAGTVRGLNNGINTDPIAAGRAPFDPALRDDAILFIGRLTPKAQLALAIDALAAIPADRRPRLEVIGSGEEQESLRAQAGALSLADHITWHGSMTDEALIAQVANRCKLFLYPGEVGLSLIHAMAYGLPAIVHSDRWRQMPEFAAFEDGVTGRSFRYGDAGSLAEVLRSLIEENKTLAVCSDESIARVTYTYNTADMARRFVEFVRRIGPGKGEPSKPAIGSKR